MLAAVTILFDGSRACDIYHLLPFVKSFIQCILTLYHDKVPLFGLVYSRNDTGITFS